MEQNLKKFLISDSVMGINDLLYKIFYVRSCLGGSILFLADRVGNNHVIKFSIEEAGHHYNRYSCSEQQYKCKFVTQLHVTIRLPAFFYNIIGIPLAAGVWIPIFGWTLNPMFGALAMSLSSFCVVTNALRLNFVKIKN